MKALSMVAIAALLLVAYGPAREAAAGGRARAILRSTSGVTATPDPGSGAPSGGSWHGDYYDTAWGMPVAVLVPPQARTQTNYAWGIGGTTVTAVQPQFKHIEPPYSKYNRDAFQPTPPWPSNTNQFGDYYIRGPW
jgi:hypothetical protein